MNISKCLSKSIYVYFLIPQDPPTSPDVTVIPPTLCTKQNANARCVYLNVKKELLYSFDDTLEIFFGRTYWNGEIKQRKKDNYTKLLQSFDIFLKYFTINTLPSPFFYADRISLYHDRYYFTRVCYPDTDVLLTAFISNR